MAQNMEDGTYLAFEAKYKDGGWDHWSQKILHQREGYFNTYVLKYLGDACFRVEWEDYSTDEYGESRQRDFPTEEEAVAFIRATALTNPILY